MKSNQASSRMVGLTGQSLPILRVCEVCSASGSDLGRSMPSRDPVSYYSLYPTFRPAAQARKRLGGDCDKVILGNTRLVNTIRSAAQGRRCAMQAHDEPHDELQLEENTASPPETFTGVTQEN
jgi:hypothetical protein